MSAPRLDAHQHFWRYEPAEYGWIDGRMGVLKRDFLPADLAPELRAAGLDGTIAVQARCSLDETRFLLALAREHRWIAGVVGWVDLTSPDAERDLDRLTGEEKLVGIRHLVQDEPDDAFLLREDFARGVSLLAGRGLVYDVLIHPRHLRVAARFVERFPEQRFVLDHLAKPPIAAGPAAARGPWADDLRALAEHPHVACKLSGLVTEAAWDAWTPADLVPYLDVAYEAFGPERVMFGSDWPVCLLAAEGYGAVHGALRSWARGLGERELDGLLGGVARRVYQPPA